jgi:hypothetical protein
MSSQTALGTGPQTPIDLLGQGTLGLVRLRS